jgi:3-hydroxyisobutyrate dehydrogenase-like beta-hydroxyacid dehydrogenase
MLADDDAVEGVVFGAKGIREGLPRDGIHVSMSTISVELAERLAVAHGEVGQTMVSSPVFGRPEAAAEAKLFVVAAGPPAAVGRVRPVLQALGQRVFEIGDVAPQANAVKLAGNFLIACVIEGLSESTAFLAKAGVKPGTFVDVLTGSLFTAPVYKTYGSLIVERRFAPPGFKLPLGLKDIRLLLRAAERLDAPLPFASVVRDQFLSAIARGYGELDWSAIALVAAANAGVPEAVA